MGKNSKSIVGNKFPAATAETASGAALTKQKAKQADKSKSEKGFPLSVRQLSLILAIVTFLLYVNTLRNDYAMDDVEILEHNSFVVKGFKGIPELLTTPHLRGFMIAPNETYRPLSLIMFAIEYQFFGANPAVSHFFNVLVFMGCVVVLFIFLNHLLGSQKTAVAFIAALLFAFHPIHTEVVANVKSRDELLCFFLGIISLVLFIKYMNENKVKLLIAGTFTLLLSLLSKETDITFLGVVPLIFFFYQNWNLKRAIQITVCTMAAAALFMILREQVLSINGNKIVSINLIDNELAKAPDYITRLGTAIYTMGLYLKLLIIPYPLISDYSYRTIPFVGLVNFWVILSMLAYVTLVIVGGYRLVKLKKDPWAFGILFFLICISLFTNITFLIGSGMGERFLFCPSVGFCLIAALAIERFSLKTGKMELAQLTSVKTAMILVPVLILFAADTTARNKEWQDNKTLYNADLQKAPNSSRLNYCVGYVKVSDEYPAETNPIEKQRLLDEGISYLKRSVEIFPEYANAQIELGNAYFINKQYDLAETHDKVALSINPSASEAINNLAGVYFVTRKFPEALELCKKAVQIRPNYAEAYYNIGLCFNNMKMHDSAIVYARKALNIDNNYHKAFTTLASSYTALNNVDSARKYIYLAKRYPQ